MISLFLIVLGLTFLAFVLAKRFVNNKQAPTSNDTHAQIAKTAEVLNLQDPVIIETPFVANYTEVKPKKKASKKSTSTAKKPSAKQKAAPKKLSE